MHLRFNNFSDNLVIKCEIMNNIINLWFFSVSHSIVQKISMLYFYLVIFYRSNLVANNLDTVKHSHLIVLTHPYKNPRRHLKKWWEKDRPFFDTFLCLSRLFHDQSSILACFKVYMIISKVKKSWQNFFPFSFY